MAFEVRPCPGGGGVWAGRDHGGFSARCDLSWRPFPTLGWEVSGSAALLELTGFDGRSVVPDTHVLFSA